MINKHDKLKGVHVMDNDYKNELDDIKFLLLDIRDNINKQTRYQRNINNIVNLVIIVAVFRFILRLILIYIIYNYGADIINGIM